MPPRLTQHLQKHRLQPQLDLSPCIGCCWLLEQSRSTRYTSVMLNMYSLHAACMTCCATTLKLSSVGGADTAATRPCSKLRGKPADLQFAVVGQTQLGPEPAETSETAPSQENQKSLHEHHFGKHPMPSPPGRMLVLVCLPACCLCCLLKDQSRSAPAVHAS